MPDRVAGRGCAEGRDATGLQQDENSSGERDQAPGSQNRRSPGDHGGSLLQNEARTGANADSDKKCCRGLRHHEAADLLCRREQRRGRPDGRLEASVFSAAAGGRAKMEGLGTEK